MDSSVSRCQSNHEKVKFALRKVDKLIDKLVIDTRSLRYIGKLTCAGVLDERRGET